MSYDLQKADIWRRASAFLLDFILATIAITGFLLLLSVITGTDNHYAAYEARMEHFSSEYDVDLKEIMAQGTYDSLSDEERAKVDKAWAEFSKDTEAIVSYNMYVQTIVVNVSLSILLSFLILEFVLPLIFKNGQTVGKKIFGIGVMRVDGVRINGQILFVRSILGKYTIETMIPVMMAAWILTGQAGLMALIIIALVIISNIVMMIATKTNSAIHDMIANTVTVDMSSQLIFDSPEALLEYKQKVHAEAVERSEYR